MFRKEIKIWHRNVIDVLRIRVVYILTGKVRHIMTRLQRKANFTTTTKIRFQLFCLFFEGRRLENCNRLLRFPL